MYTPTWPVFPEFERLEIVHVDDVPCIEIIGDHYTVNYQIWFDDCPVETKFVSEQRLQGSRGKLCLVYKKLYKLLRLEIFHPKQKERFQM